MIFFIYLYDKLVNVITCATFFVISFFFSCEKGRPAKEASYYMGETTVEPPIRTVCEERW